MYGYLFRLALPAEYLAVLGILIAGSSVTADDIVSVRRLQGNGITQRKGTIAEYTGEFLELTLPGNRQEKFRPTKSRDSKPRFVMNM